jgi:hypothetical protein
MRIPGVSSLAGDIDARIQASSELEGVKHE